MFIREVTQDIKLALELRIGVLKWLVVYFLEIFHYVVTEGSTKVNNQLHAQVSSAARCGVMFLKRACEQHSGFLVDRLIVQRLIQRSTTKKKMPLTDAQLMKLTEKWDQQCTEVCLVPVCSKRL